MDIQQIIGKEKELFTFMQQEGYPVFHKSNIFLRDIQYGIRDFYRMHFNKDIGSRKADAFAASFVNDLESRNIFKPFGRNTWILNMEMFRKHAKVEENKEAEQAR